MRHDCFVIGPCVNWDILWQNYPKALGRTGPGVGYAVQRGERIAKQMGFKLVE